MKRNLKTKMIRGIGCDIVDLKRLDFENENFVLKILTTDEYLIFKEKNTCKQKREFLGGRFAVKEAFFKACGIEEKILSFREIEVLNDANGKPYINYPNTFISIAHENDYAIAYVIVEEG